MSGVRIRGATRLFAIVGDPIAQVRSPEVLSERFHAAGIDAVVIPLHVPAERFDATMRALMAVGNLDGLLVTVPHKARAMALADRIGNAARRVGAVNALRRESDGAWYADMFDGVGFVRAAIRNGATIPGASVALFGAGGAGSAIGFELAAAGASAIAVIDPAGDRAATLARGLRDAFPRCDARTAASVPAGAGVIVNASTIGMNADDALPGEIGTLPPSAFVGDVVVAPQPTAIIRHAMRHGCSFATGRDMHAGQVDVLIEFLSAALPATARAAA